MAKLDSTNRAKLPDSAFAYVDARGNRRLPINDAAHVKNALARFSQVKFEDEKAREKARKRLLNAAKKFGIVPVGFISGQLESERELGKKQARTPVELPSGIVTMMMTDIEGSTGLVHQLGDGYGALINDVRLILEQTASDTGGHVVETRADEFFAVFEAAPTALDAAIAIQRALGERTWADGLQVRVRMGLHTGKPTINAENYIGMAVHTAARICDAAHGGQIIVSAATRDAVKGAANGVRFRSLGEHKMRGLPELVPLYQVTAKGLAVRFPVPRTLTVPAGGTGTRAPRR